MNSLQLTPYLAFNGTCREAMHFYQECLGGELMIQPFAGTPAAEHVVGDAQNGVLHSTLTSGSIVLMASDAGSQPVTPGDSVSLSLQCHSAEEIATLFAKLSAGGIVTMPLADAFWGATFGMFTDRFGINWLLNFDKQGAAQ